MDRRNGAAGENAGGGRRCWHRGLGVVGAFAVGLQSLAGPVSGFVPITSQARGELFYIGSHFQPKMVCRISSKFYSRFAYEDVAQLMF